MRLFIGLFLSLFLFLPVLAWSSESSAESVTSLKDYLTRALPSATSPDLPPDDSTLFFRETELRVGSDDQYFKSAKLRFYPFAWNERSHQKQLSKIENELYALQALESSSGRSYEIGKLVVALAAEEKKLALLKDMMNTCVRVVATYERHLVLLSEKPDDYVKRLQERLETDQAIHASEALVQHMRASLAKAAGIAAENFSLNLDDLISLEEIEKKVQAWPTTQLSPSLRSKNLLLSKAELEAEMEGDRKGWFLNYFDVGASLKEDGSPDTPEFGFGLSIPLFSGEYKGREYELATKKLAAASDAELSRFQGEQEADFLKQQILYRAERYKTESGANLESSIRRVQKQTNEKLGSGSLEALNIELALEKLRISQHEARSPAWEEFVDLANILGKLDSSAQILVSPSPPQKGG